MDRSHRLGYAARSVVTCSDVLPASASRSQHASTWSNAELHGEACRVLRHPRWLYSRAHHTKGSLGALHGE